MSAFLVYTLFSNRPGLSEKRVAEVTTNIAIERADLAKIMLKLIGARASRVLCERSI